MRRRRGTSQVVVVEEQGTGTKKTAFALSTPPLPPEKAWLGGTGEGLPRPPGQRRLLARPIPPLGPPRRGQRMPHVQHAETREAMQDAIRHALACAGTSQRPRRTEKHTLQVDDAQSGQRRSVLKQPPRKQASPPRVADFMQDEDKDTVAIADLDRFNSSDEEGAAEGHDRLPQVDGAGDSDDGSARKPSEPSDVASSSSGSGGGGGAADGERQGAAAEEAASAESSAETPGIEAPDEMEENDAVGEDTPEPARVAATWGLRRGCAMFRREEPSVVRARWQERRAGLGAEWRSLKRAAEKTKGKKRPRRGDATR